MSKETLHIDVSALKAEHSLVDFIQRAGVTLRKKGRDYWGCCPFHDEKAASFSVSDKGGSEFYKCFGCGAKGDIVSFARHHYNLSFPEAVKMITGKDMKSTRADLNALNRGAGGRKKTQRQLEIERQDQRRAAWNYQKAKEIYKEGEGDAPELSNYLKNRGIDVAKIGGVPPTLRFIPALDHYPTKSKYPAMVAPIQDASGRFMAVHRTYLERCTDDAGHVRYKKADVERAKIVLGACSGGCIRLGPVSDHLMIAEGIETALSVKMFYPHASVWAAYSLSNFGAIILPPQVQRVTLLGDNDMKPPKNGQKDPKEMMHEAAVRLKKQAAGRKVALAWPHKGEDFNDMLRGMQR